MTTIKSENTLVFLERPLLFTVCSDINTGAAHSIIMPDIDNNANLRLTKLHHINIKRKKPSGLFVTRFVNADKTKYMIMSGDQNAGRSHSMKIDNSSIERVEEFKFLGTTLTNKNSIQEEIKSRLKVGNVCCYSVQNLLSSSLLSKKLRSRYIEL